MEFMSCTISDTWVMGLVGTLISWGKDRSVCERDRQTDRETELGKEEGRRKRAHAWEHGLAVYLGHEGNAFL